VKRSLAILLSAAALVTACGDDDDGSTATTTPGAEVDEGDAPERIVALSATAVEILFAIGAGDAVVAVDENADYPAEVLDLPHDLSGFEPNVEAIAELDPDLVVISNDNGDVQAGLEALDIEVLLQPAAVTIDDTYAQIDELGAATGHAEEAAAVVEEVEDAIEELVAQVPDRTEEVTFFHELDDQLFTVTSETFIGQVYELAGLTNIADAADPNGEFGGYPQLTSEFLVQADPDFIFLADAECCQQDAETLAARPGFADLTAITSGQVVALDEDLASRWGPRVVDFLAAVVEATT
jgi:iron complex transport system substrate-binding protein